MVVINSKKEVLDSFDDRGINLVSSTVGLLNSLAIEEIGTFDNGLGGSMLAWLGVGDSSNLAWLVT